MVTVAAAPTPGRGWGSTGLVSSLFGGCAKRGPSNWAVRLRGDRDLSSWLSVALFSCWSSCSGTGPRGIVFVCGLESATALGSRPALGTWMRLTSSRRGVTNCNGGVGIVSSRGRLMPLPGAAGVWNDSSSELVVDALLSVSVLVDWLSCVC